MVEVAIYGAGKCGCSAIKRIQKFYNDKVKIAGILDANKSGEICDITIIKPELLPKDTVIVICIASRKDVVEAYEYLRTFGFKKIVLYIDKNNPPYRAEEDFLQYECIKIENKKKDIIPHIEIHAADDCNLNCRGCVHFSPLFKGEKMRDLDCIIKDIKGIAHISENILSLFILGGEPLQSPFLKDMLVEARNILPKTNIEVVTNGLKIPSCSGELLESIQKNGIIVVISVYKPTYAVLDKIISRLEEYKIDYIIRPFDTKQKFIKPLSLSINSNLPKVCTSNGCVNVYDGKVARCPVLMYIHKVNEKFDKLYPEVGIFGLTHFLSAKELNSEMAKEIPLCQYCVNVEIDWEPCGKDPIENDFITEE